MKQENLTPFEQLIRSAAPRVQADEARNARLLQSMQAAAVFHRKRRILWWRTGVAAAVVALLLVGGFALYHPQPLSSPCYTGRISAEAAGTLLPSYETRNNMSYGIAAGEYEIVITDVTL